MTHRTAAILASVALLAAASFAHEPNGPTCALSIGLVDRATGETLPGIVQVRDATGEIVELPELVNRGEGIESIGPIHDWWVIPRARTVTVSAAPLTIHALAGLETELGEKRIDLTGQSQATVQVALDRFCDARRSDYLAGNTHLHLMKLSRAEADEYLKQVPLADGLDIVFLSYLERAKADLEYTSNKYTPANWPPCRTGTCISAMAKNTGTTSERTARDTATSCCSTFRISSGQ